MITPGHSFDVGALRSYGRDRLAPYQVPTELLEMRSLPTTTTGKPAREALREEVVVRRLGAQLP